MKRIAATALALACVLATPVWAALKPGDTAPVFTAQAALDGKDYTFSLADALKKGPVVLYFFPKAFTTGCTAEAHAFAEAADEFTAMGASLIGMSADDIGTLHKFSTQACSGKFPVAADPDLKVIRAYDSAWCGSAASASPTVFPTSSHRTARSSTPSRTAIPTSMSRTRWRRSRRCRRSSHSRLFGALAQEMRAAPMSSRCARSTAPPTPAHWSPARTTRDEMGCSPQTPSDAAQTRR